MIHIINCMDIIISELRKSWYSNFMSVAHYIALFIWPFLNLLELLINLNIYDMREIKIKEMTNSFSFIIFILIGFLSSFLYNQLTITSLETNNDRYNGTLEAVWMSPVNKLKYVFSKSLSGIFSAFWSIAIILLAVLVFLLYANQNMIGSILACVFSIIMSALFWGAFLVSLCLLFRDTGIIFSLIQAPQDAICGTEVPVEILPEICKKLSILFPLTHTIILARNIIYGEHIFTSLLASIGINIVLLGLTKCNLVIANWLFQNNGEFNYF